MKTLTVRCTTRRIQLPKLLLVRPTWAAVVLVAVHGSAARAQPVERLVAGASVRARGDRATNDGVRQFTVRGIVASADSTRIVVVGGRADTPPDTVALVGVRRLDLFAGTRPRRSRILTGAAVAGAAASTAWLLARLTLDPETRQGQGLMAYSERSFSYERGSPPAIVGRLRTAIPIAAVAGGLLGSVIGAEQWVRIPIPQSMFPEAR